MPRVTALTRAAQVFSNVIATPADGLRLVDMRGKQGDVLTLQFDNVVSDKGVKPLRYREGQYLYLQCPAVDGKLGPLAEWHPFTISSAAGDLDFDDAMVDLGAQIAKAQSCTPHDFGKLPCLDVQSTGRRTPCDELDG